MTQTTHAIRSALLICAILFKSSEAAAQTTAGQPEQPPIKIGPVELWPSLVFRGIGRDPNVFNEAEDVKSDFTATAASGLEAVIRPRRLRLSYLTTSDFVYFHKFKSERSINRGSSARVEADLTYFHPFASYSASRGRARPNSEIDLRARSTVRGYGAGVRTVLGPSASVTVSARRNTSAFDPDQEPFRGVDLATELNHETTALEGSFNLALTPLTSVGLQVTKEKERFDNSPLRNSESLRVAPTIAFQPFGLFTGSATVGWRRFDADDPDVEDYSGLAASGSIGLSLRERYHIETRFGRDIRTSYESRTPTYVWTSAYGTLRTDLFGGLDVRLSGGQEVLSYKPLRGTASAPRDRLLLYSLGLGYNVTRKLRVGVDAEFTQRKAEEGSRGYKSDRVMGTVVWGVRG